MLLFQFDFKHDSVTINGDMDLNMGGPLVNAAAVIGHNGWLAGQNKDSSVQEQWY